MVEGLKVTVKGGELIELCFKRAEYHRKRVAAYAKGEKALDENELEGMNYSGGDPKRALAERKKKHDDEAAEMEFIAGHLLPDDDYLLDRNDLMRLGIVRGF